MTRCRPSRAGSDMVGRPCLSGSIARTTGATRARARRGPPCRESAWYLLRYPSTESAGRAFDRELTRKWLPVSTYIGGNEHAVLHLMYSRFITMALHDLGLLAFEETYG